MRKSSIIRLFLALLLCLSLPAHASLWRSYTAYSEITQVQKAGNTLYVLASKRLFAYNTTDKSIQTFDRVNGLSDTPIAFIAWNNVAKRLVVVYDNQNIDFVMPNGDVHNLSDYYRKSMMVDKTVFGVNTYGANTYLATGFGIIKLDARKMEINDTYNLGFKVNWVRVEGNRILAYSDVVGCYAASLTTNLNDKNNWTRVGAYQPDPQATPDASLIVAARKANVGGPRYNNFYFIKHTAGRLYTVGGVFASGGTQKGYPGLVQVLEANGSWTFYQDSLYATTGIAFNDINCLAVDPLDPNHVFIGGRPGLYEFQDGRFKTLYNSDNSPLLSAVDRGVELGNNYVIVNAVDFDAQGNLWLANSQTRSQSLLTLPRGKKMESRHQERLMADGLSLRNMTKMLVDSRGWVWFCNDHWIFPSLTCYKPATGECTVYNTFTNQDGVAIHVNAVTCVTEDREGNLWVGTNVAPLYLQIRNNQAEKHFVQFKIPRNDGTNNADYLLNEVHITHIAIDGANRKWMGTLTDGAYLISADNLQQVQHFNSANSPLISNAINSIAINPTKGEVFFATDNGLCSYQGDATEPQTGDDREAYAYPNPVEPGYKGLVRIVNLSPNAYIKIVSPNGTLVKEGRSNGGMFTWDGNDLRGQRVVSGVYVVLEATEEGKSGVACKVAVVN